MSSVIKKVSQQFINKAMDAKPAELQLVANKTDEELEDNIGTLMKMLERAYPDAPQVQDEDTMLMYMGLLRDLPIVPLAIVVKQHIATKLWFPRVAELRDQVIELCEPSQPTAAEAWNELSQVIASSQCYRAGGGVSKPKMENPITKEILDNLDFWSFYQLPTLSQQKIFLSAYERIAKRKNDDSRLLPETRAIRQIDTKSLLRGAMEQAMQLKAAEDEGYNTDTELGFEAE